MKYVDGVFRILIGIAFIFLRVLESINYEHIGHLNTRLNRIDDIYVDFWGRVFWGGEYAYTIHTYSYVPIIIAAIFITWGIITIAVPKKKKKLETTYRR